MRVPMMTMTILTWAGGNIADECVSVDKGLWMCRAFYLNGGVADAQVL